MKSIHLYKKVFKYKQHKTYIRNSYGKMLKRSNFELYFKQEFVKA